MRFDVPVMIAASLLTFIFSFDGRIGRFDGILLVAGGVVYTVALIGFSHRGNAAAQEEKAREHRSTNVLSVEAGLVRAVSILAGLGLLILGARWLVDGAVAAARILGVSELVIGLTIVAAGTSLPEVATSVVASLRGERDIAVGNVVGSNIFNILAVLGVSGILAPDGISVPSGAMGFDIPVMIAVSLACLPVFFTGHFVARWEGSLFLAYYGAYTIYLVLASAQHGSLPAFNAAMISFVIPLTLLTLVVTIREVRVRKAG